MGQIIDTSVWIDYLRAKTPLKIKHFADKIINDSESFLCEPVRFELLRSVPAKQKRKLEEFLFTFPNLSTPDELWTQATRLGQKVCQSGFNSRPLDILIAQISIHHQVALATFDSDFMKIAKTCSLQVSYFDRSKI